MDNKKKKLNCAVDILREKLTQIDRVEEWAEACNFKCPKHFSRTFRNHYGTRPVKILKKVKTNKAIELLSNGDDISNYEVAQKIGKRDEQALYHFVKGQTGNPPRFYKSKK